jgi:uncharacterized protein (TIGR02099 family)
VLLTAARLWVPELGGYRSEIEKLASESLHRTVTIGRMTATWRGMNPVLKLREVAIADPARPEDRLLIKQVWIGLDISTYAYERQLRIASIDIIGADLTVIRETGGQIHIERLGGAAGGNSDMSGLLAGRRLAIHDSTVSFHDLQQGRPPLRFAGVTLRLKNSADRRTLSGYAMLPPELGYRVDIEANIKGRVERPGDWSGRFYVNGQSLSLSPDNLRYLAPGMDVHGTADVRCWIDMKDARLKSVRGEFEINRLRARQPAAESAADYFLDRFSARFGWRTRRNGWQFAARDMLFAQGETVRQGTALSLASRRLGENAYFSGILNGLNLQDLQTLVGLVPAAVADYRRLIVQWQPEGIIESLDVDLKSSDGALDVLRLNTAFRDLGIRPQGAGPEIRGLEGSITGLHGAGTLWLADSAVSYRDDAVFRDALAFDAVSGEAAWRYADGSLAIDNGDFKLENSDFSLAVQLALDLPGGGKSPLADLQIDIDRGKLGSIRHYLPAGIMPKSGVAWLDRSLVSGEISGGRFVLQGRLDQLPFDHGEGQLLARLPVTDAILDYDEGWSPIRQLDAQVDFTGRSMDIRSQRGRIRSASLTAVQAGIQDLEHPDLQLRGSVRGPLPVMLAELNSSPLGDTYGSFVERTTAQGNARLDLEVFIPLHGEDRPIDVKGNIRLDGNALRVKAEGGAVLKAIQGELAFTTEGITGRDLQARLLDKPVTVDVWTDSKDSVTSIRMQGPLDLAGLLAERQPVVATVVSGHTDWEVLLRIGRLEHRDETPRVGLDFSSRLQGLAIDLPTPFGKAAQESRPLAITIDRVLHPAPELHLRYGEQLMAAFRLKQAGAGFAVERGNIAVGGATATLPGRKELLISGRLEQVPTSQWRPVLAAGEGGSGLPLRLDLLIDDLEIMHYHLRDVGLLAEETGLVQNLHFSGPTIDGDIQLARSGRNIERIVVNLDRLFLQQEASASDAGVPAIRPAAFPDLHITIKKFRYNGVKFGQAQLQTRRQQDAVHVDDLVVVSDMLDVRANGDWREQDGEAFSQFELTINNGRLEKLLKAFDYREEVSGGDMSGWLRASWRGTPWEFRPDQVEGKLYLLITDGQLLNVKPGAGRVFGLVSLHTLQRRLSLDFSDLVKKGFAFDRIEGHFALDDGDAYTNDLFIEGPAARIDISGRIGLAGKDYDEVISVAPHLSSSLPLAGAIAGGPAVGAALLVAQRLLGKQLEQATRLGYKQYTVTGPWSDPVYTVVEIPPAGTGKDSAAEPREVE